MYNIINETINRNIEENINNNSVINSIENDKNMFIYGCKMNMINFVKYLYNKNNSKIKETSIKLNNDNINTIYLGFIISIYNNNLSILKWIHSLNIIDIDIYRYHSYNLACILKLNHILEWFNSIDAKYNYLIVNNKYKPNIYKSIPYYIRNKEWEKIINTLNIKIDNNLELEECSICYEKSNILTKCKHTYCIECLCNWYIMCSYKKEICPYCRNSIKLTECTYKENN